MRSSIDTESTLWYTTCEKMADDVGFAIEIPRITGWPQHRDNATASSTQEHFKWNVAIPFIDYTTLEIKARFKAQDTHPCQAIFSLLPANTMNFLTDDTSLKLTFWKADLPAPPLLTNMLREWMAHWEVCKSSISHSPISKCRFY